ncbi:MAG: class I SAM-dependent methyltransferase, partial [Desulforhopalus sp.]
QFEQRNIVAFAKKQLLNPQTGRPVQPVMGRFYPQGYAWRALGCFPQNNNPFRVLENSGDQLLSDANHPLARYPLTVEARLVDRGGGGEEHGGGSTDIAAEITSGGPGMQIPLSQALTDFYATYPFTRLDNTNDETFYRLPRFVNHLDDTAAGQVRSLHARLLSSGWRILDLMSSWVSHLPSTITDHETTGLGMNEEELRANSQLKHHIVHDLNLSPRLPFADNEFDAAICTASIEYLTQPL